MFTFLEMLAIIVSETVKEVSVSSFVVGGLRGSNAISGSCCNIGKVKMENEEDRQIEGCNVSGLAEQLWSEITSTPPPSPRRGPPFECLSSLTQSAFLCDQIFVNVYCATDEDWCLRWDIFTRKSVTEYSSEQFTNRLSISRKCSTSWSQRLIRIRPVKQNFEL